MTNGPYLTVSTLCSQPQIGLQINSQTRRKYLYKKHARYRYLRRITKPYSRPENKRRRTSNLTINNSYRTRQYDIYYEQSLPSAVSLGWVCATLMCPQERVAGEDVVFFVSLCIHIRTARRERMTLNILQSYIFSCFRFWFSSRKEVVKLEEALLETSPSGSQMKHVALLKCQIAIFNHLTKRWIFHLEIFYVKSCNMLSTFR